MTRARIGVAVTTALACVMFASGCPKDDDKTGVGNASQDGGSSGPGVGSGGSQHTGSGGSTSNGAHAGSGGNGSNDMMSGGEDAGGSGHVTLDAGGANGGGGALDAGSAQSGACKVGGCSSELCTDGTDNVVSPCIWRDEYACYKDATCERQADGQCGWTDTPALQKCLANPTGAGGGALHWFQTCGAPVCMAGDTPFDDPNVPNCTKDQTEGAACDTKDQLCDGVASCGASLVCSDQDPTMGPGGCPRSRARYKQDIEYLDARQLRDYHAQLMSLPLASYRYKNAPAAPQLGFIIDDVEPSVAVAGDHVNMYGYLSMAVAAIQVQAQQIDALQHEVEQLRSQLPSEPAMCTQP
jgi:endosialidase-like protein